MKNFIQHGDVLTLTPAAAVASGEGYLAGALFGVATGAVAANTPGEFKTSGVFELPKTSALAINVGDVVYWDAAAKVVNKTTAGQRGIGVAVATAGNPSASVKVRLGVSSIAGT
jgi:predicted RecA/RadA family phage recombinase